MLLFPELSLAAVSKASTKRQSPRIPDLVLTPSNSVVAMIGVEPPLTADTDFFYTLHTLEVRDLLC